MLRYRKTKTGEWVVYGPKREMYKQTSVVVTKKDGTTKTERLAKVGRGFDVGGVEYAYGYIEQPQPCDECGRPGATIKARDLSGIPGVVCDRCANEIGYLSFN